MKIVNVRFANINSLKGEFEIDFTNPELTGHGIFAIFGETGSGKTTILDAITLALFGRTSRLNVSASENELMTRGAGFCHSEVVFETTVEGRPLVFRTIWEQRRARNLPSGALQQPKMNLVQVSHKLSTDDWESDKISQVPDRVDKVTGLDFNRFTRTCLLAQGQFAAFLDAKSSERAQILEQITGTEIYYELSKAAFERDREATAKVDLLRSELQGITVMSDEEFLVLQQRVEALKLERDASEAQKGVIQGHIAWITTLNTLLGNQVQLLEQQQLLGAERESHATEFAALANGRKAEPARVPITQRDGLVEKRRKREAELTETRTQLPLVQKAFTDFQAHLEATRKNRLEFQNVAEVEQKLIKDVRTLDQQIKSHKEHHLGISRQHGLTAKQLAESEVQVQSLGKTIAGFHQQLANLNAALEKAVADKTLGGDLKALEALVVKRQEVRAQLVLAEKEQGGLKSRMNAAQSELETIGKNVKKAVDDVAGRTAKAKASEETIAERFPDITINSLQGRIKQAQKHLTDATALQTLAGEFQELGDDAKKAKKAISGRTKETQAAEKTLATLEKDHEKIATRIDELNEERTRFQTMASFDQHRQQLEDGKPCPLCGGLEHPYAEANLDKTGLKEIDARLKKEKANQKKVAESIKEVQAKLTRLSAEQAVDEQTIKNHGKDTANLQKKWDKLAKGFEQAVSPENGDQLDTLVAAAESGFKRAEADFARFQEITEIRDKAEKALTKAKEKLQGLEKEQTGIQGTVNQAAALSQKAAQRCSELVQQTTTIEADLCKDLLCYGIPEFDDEVLPKLKVRWETYQGIQKKIEMTVQDEQKSQQKLAAASAQKAELSQQLVALQEALAKAEALLIAVQKSRVEIYADKDPDVEEKKLQVAAAAHQAGEESASAQLQSCQLKLEGLRTSEKAMLTDLETLTLEIAEAQKALDSIRQTGDFPDESSLRAALLPLDEFKRLSDLEKQFETRAAQLQGQLEGLVKQIADHETQRPTSQTFEELTLALTAQAEKASLALSTWQEQWKLLATNQENREKHKSLIERILATQKEGERWGKLNMLIGSGNGKKFQEFAQGLTFSHLVYQANQQLKKLTDRYHLANSGLEMQIIDRYIANAKASAKNLSGGEKFLASLALALGLAQMVGQRYRMDTLFIDEGFGALDPRTLETAITVLCGLQQQGKLIGIISHVEGLKERLPVKLEVLRLGGGLSTITGPGCKRHS